MKGSLTKATITGSLWNYLTFGSGKTIVFITTIVLARLLTPDDFGIVALSLLVITFLDRFRDFGVGEALVYHKGDIDLNSDVAFWISVIVSLLIAITAFFCAPLVSEFFDEPRLMLVLKVFSLLFIINGLANIHVARIKREMKFERRFKAESFRNIVKGVVGIGLALYGFGVWSLVWGQVSGATVAMITYWRSAKWRPRFRFSLSTAHVLSTYGGHIVLLGALGVLLSRFDQLVIGHRLDATQLGFYVLAFMIPDMIITNTCYVLSQALFPAYSKIRDDNKALKSAYIKSLKLISLVIAPAAMGIFVIASEFVETFYSSKWLPAVPVVQVLVLGAMVGAMSFNLGDVYKAIGRPQILTKIATARMFIELPLLWIVAPLGIIYIATVLALANLVRTIVQFYIASRVLSLKISSVVRAIRPALYATVVMFICLYIVRYFIYDLSPPVRLLILVPTGVVIYLVNLYFGSRDTFNHVIHLFRSFRKA